jgi:hypothetical protein
LDRVCKYKLPVARVVIQALKPGNPGLRVAQTRKAYSCGGAEARKAERKMEKGRRKKEDGKRKSGAM